MNFCFVHRILILITIAPSAWDEVVGIEKGSIGEIAIYFLCINGIENAVAGFVEKGKIKNPRNLGAWEKGA